MTSTRMKIVDRFTTADKTASKLLRDLDSQVDVLLNTARPERDNFAELFALQMELFIHVFKRLDNNSKPARTLLDFTNAELQDACNRVGPATAFANDRDFVQAVLIALTKGWD
jgi:hypothetical protein